MALDPSALEKAFAAKRREKEPAKPEKAQRANASARKAVEGAKPDPASPDIEEAVLAVCVQCPDKIPEVRGSIWQNHFTERGRKIIFQALSDLHDSGGTVDPLKLTQFLSDNGKFDDIGGEILVKLQTMNIAEGVSLEFYLDTLREKMTLRELIRTGKDMIRAGNATTEGSEVAGVVARFGSDMDRIRQHAGGSNGVHELTTTQLREMKGLPDKNVLVGNRWLVRGGNCLWAGGAGYGKSSLTMQLAVYWACGQSVFGLRPHFPIKSLIIQAENDDFDMAEQYNGVLEGIAAIGDLDIDAQTETIDKNLIVLRMEGVSGFPFLSKLSDLLQLYRPSILWLDPLFAFAGCDLLDAEKVGHFLREGLFPLFTKHNCCGQVIHHVGKPPRAQENQDRSALDEQYLSFGTSEIQNAFRAVNILKPPIKSMPAFRLVFSKRGDRCGAKDLDGNYAAARTVFLDHAKGHICWVQIEEPEPENKPGAATKYTMDDILKEMSGVNGMTAEETKEHMKKECGMSPRTFYRIWKELKNSGKIAVDSDGKWTRKGLLL